MSTGWADWTPEGWTALPGPDIGGLRSIVAGPTGELYAVGVGGVSRSDDGGATWSSKNEGLVYPVTYFFYPCRCEVEHVDLAGGSDLAVLPDGDLVLVAEEMAELVFRSEDRGETWMQVDSPSTAYRPQLTVAGDDLFIASRQVLFGGQGGVLLRSSDGGFTWTDLTDNLPVTSVSALADGGNGVLYAATGDFLERTGALHRSTDRGESWTEIESGDYIETITPLADGRMILGGFEWTRFLDGESLSARTTHGLADVAVLAFTERAGELFAATYDGGVMSWTGSGWTTLEGTGAERFLGITRDATGRLFAIANEPTAGVVRSADGGATWRLSNAGLNHFGLISASDHEDGWLYSSFWPTTSDYNSFAFVYKNQNAMVRSSDGGVAWEDFGAALREQVPGREIEIDGPDKLSDGSLVILVSNDLGSEPTSGEPAIWRSHDDGATWSRMDLPEEVYFFAGSSAGTLFSMFGDGSFQRSEDDGVSWSPVEGVSNITSFIESSSGALLAFSWDGIIHRSVDDGLTWSSVSGYGEKPYQLPSGTLLASTFASGILRSTDDGVTWTSTEEGIEEANQFVDSWAIDRDGVVWAGLNGFLFTSTDDGQSWTRQLHDLVYARPMFTDDQGRLVIWAAGADGTRLYRQGSEPQRRRVAIPAVARAAGAGGSFFTSKLTVFNSGDAAVTVDITYTPRADLEGEAITVSEGIGAGQLWVVDDPLGELFGFSDGDVAVGSAMIEVTDGPGEALIVSSVVSAKLGDGSEYGQFFPALDDGDALAAGQTSWLATTEDAVINRVNVGLMGLDEFTVVEVVPVTPKGTELADPASFELDAGSNLQINDVHTAFELGQVSDVLVEVRVLSGAAHAYSSLLDGTVTAPGTSDPTTILPVTVGSDQLTFLQLGSIQGIDEFSGSGSLTNLAPEPMVVQIDFYERNQSGVAASNTVEIGAGETVGSTDMVGDLIGVTGAVGTAVATVVDGPNALAGRAREFAIIKDEAGERVGTAGQLMPGWSGLARPSHRVALRGPRSALTCWVCRNLGAAVVVALRREARVATSTAGLCNTRPAVVRR